MAESSAKKRRTTLYANTDRITDPRFANIQSDPRYRLPGKKNKVKLDRRFTRALQDDDFSRKAKVDRYGRPLEADSERKRLKRKYDFEEEEDEQQSDEPDDDEAVEQELQRVDKTHDPLREGRDVDTSSSESSSDEDSDVAEDVEVAGDEQPDVPLGEVSSRLAVVNLDWDNIRAEDLMVVFSSETLLGSNGRLLKASIYPSEFGKERMLREETEGPPKEIFAGQKKEGEDTSESEDHEDDKEIKESILKPDDGADFDSQTLRQYQLDRLRYFYAVLKFSSTEAAKAIYDAVDGTEYLSTANFFDLRFIPDDTDFSADIPREECHRIPAGYKPNDFVTDALQHSKVKLTWDAEDGSRKEAAARAFRGGRKEIDENDLKAYLGTDSSGSEDEFEESERVPASSLSKKEAERQKMRSLLGLAPEPEKHSGEDKTNKQPFGGVQITFSAGLSTMNEKSDKKRSVFENSPEPDETTVERYVRKEKERKAKRKERSKAAREGYLGADDDPADVDAPETRDAAKGEPDLGFEDPFFVEPVHDKTLSSKLRKEERTKKRKEREADEAAEKKQRAELELLMVDDREETGEKGGRVRHFDMKEIEKAEKEARRKERKGKNKSAKSKKGANGQALVDGDDDSFNVDAADPRFARLFENHDFAIDPTNPKYKRTKGMEQLLEEGRRRKTKIRSVKEK